MLLLDLTRRRAEEEGLTLSGIVVTALRGHLQDDPELPAVWTTEMAAERLRGQKRSWAQRQREQSSEALKGSGAP